MQRYERTRIEDADEKIQHYIAACNTRYMRGIEVVDRVCGEHFIWTVRWTLRLLISLCESAEQRFMHITTYNAANAITTGVALCMERCVWLHDSEYEHC